MGAGRSCGFAPILYSKSRKLTAPIGSRSSIGNPGAAGIFDRKLGASNNVRDGAREPRGLDSRVGRVGGHRGCYNESAELTVWKGVVKRSLRKERAREQKSVIGSDKVQIIIWVLG